MNFCITFCIFIALFFVLSDGVVYYSYYTGQTYPLIQQKCEIKSNGLKTIEDVQKAIDKARDGDIIRLDPIVYEGNLLVSTNNQKYISIVGDNQCFQNTVIRGQITIRSHNIIVNAIVFEKTKTAVNAEKVANIRLMNLVLREINGNGIEVNTCNSVLVENLVIDNIEKNALDFSKVTDVSVANSVISNIGGVAIKFDHCYRVSLVNNVARNIVQEVIKFTGNVSNVLISQTVINGDSPRGQGWMYLEGDNYLVQNCVATGAPVNGIVVKGCNNQFTANVFTIQSYSAYAIYLANKSRNCSNIIGITNISIGGQGIHN